MKRILAIAMLCAASIGLHAQTGWVTVTASNLTDATGAKIASGAATFCPVNTNGARLAFRVNGNGQAMSSCVATSVTNGALSLTLADTNLTSPQNVCYSLTIKDSSSGSLLLGGYGSGYTCLQPAYSNTWCVAGACNLDNFAPTGQALVIQQTGPTGPQGPAGAAGPNTVSTSTATNITGPLAGDGSHVGAATSISLPVFDKGGAVYNVKAYGAKLDARFSNPDVGQAGCATTAAAITVTCADLNFTSADVGKLFTVRCGGTSSAVLKTTIAGVTNSTTATMANSAATTVTAGTECSRASVGTDDTAAFNAAIAAAHAAGGGVVYVQANYTMVQGPITLVSGVGIAGAGAKSATPSGAPPDFNLYPTGGTWIDCYGASSCFSGSNLIQVNLSDFGMTDTLKGIAVGSNGVAGAAFSKWINLFVSGNSGVAAANFSTIAYDIWNTQHLYADHLISGFVSEGLHLATQGAATVGYTSANNTFRDLYTFTNGHTVANGNINQPGVLIENLDGAGGIMGGNVFSGQFQINDYGGDGTGSHLVLNAHSARIEGQRFDYMDIEGTPFLCGISLQGDVDNSEFHMNGVNGTTGYCGNAAGAGLHNLIEDVSGETLSGLGPSDFVLGWTASATTINIPGLYRDNSGFWQLQLNQYGTASAGSFNASTSMSTQLITATAPSGGAIAAKFGAIAGSPSAYTSFDSYGNQVTSANCNSSLFATDTNRGAYFGCPFGVLLGGSIASASTIGPNTMAFHVTGTAVINTITPPLRCSTSSTSCTLRIIPDGAFTTTTAGNIAIASTAVVGKVLEMTYDSTAAKWYPSY